MLARGMRPYPERPASEPTRSEDISLCRRIGAVQRGLTLAAVLRAELAGLPWSKARELCRRGKVCVNGQLETDGSRRLETGDEVALAPHAPRQRQHVLDDAAIVYIDRQLVVVNKPAGLLSVPFSQGDKNTLADRLRFWLQRQAGARDGELGAVQRLDKDTTGLLVFARTLAAKRDLQQQLRVHSIERRYLALVHGRLGTQLTIENQLVRDRGDGLRGSWERMRKRGRAAPSDAQHAITHVRPLEPLAGATLVECRIETGRQHQIRIHLSEQGHPLLGEPVYIRDHDGPCIAAQRPMLHAAVLGFVHPSNQQALRFEIEPPEDFAALRAQLGGSSPRAIASRP
jgi:23S rRNA pseudouridine1911/1915/1917 synthase